MGPENDLPLHSSWTSSSEYVESLLHFITGNHLFRNLCGGIHILDFLTRDPDLYSTVLPEEWMKWFDLVSIDDVLYLLLHARLDKIEDCLGDEECRCWKSRTRAGVACPPSSLLQYIVTIQRHCLRRDYERGVRQVPEMPRHISVGMKPKKIHEVAEFAAYVSELFKEVETDEPERSIVDFGSGQNYLGRTLASPPYETHVIAIERRHHNVDGAKDKDVLAKFASKEKIMRNKKEFKKQIVEGTASLKWQSKEIRHLPGPKHELPVSILQHHTVSSETGKGSMTYIEASIDHGKLEHILCQSSSSNKFDSEHSSTDTSLPSADLLSKPPLIVISLHSCGNLLHHGLRSLVLNESVTAVALIGCCYNLMTERLGPTTYKLPQLRPNHPRLEATGSACDPHGFPMSRTLEEYCWTENDGSEETGVRLNITARMMAVQAPYNWGKEDSELFFRRHFYRALLQRILLDRGVVKRCTDAEGNDVAGGGLSNGGNSLSGKDAEGTPLIVGSLRKACFTSFRAYVRGALEKLVASPSDGMAIEARMADLTEGEIDRYEMEFGYAKKNLAVIWSLMAFSAGVVESVIAVDRWAFLKEQDCVERCWVEPIFDYRLSPRNLVVVGIKKKGWTEEKK